ncbi:unnamed protein product [Anisakis simplex]|uniref:Transmembrane protein n=1 Tax=Anisakis simplex TaxID=6269 RepID=A0A0M3KE52_ANISI|nr:unnamed protein product [Anisakis simplex]
MEKQRHHSTDLWTLHNVRIWIAILLAAALCIEGLMRSNLNMAMVCMVNRTAVVELQSKTGKGSTSQIRPSIISTNSSADEHETNNESTINLPPTCKKLPSRGRKSYNGKLVWTAKEQAWIFASFYAGGLFVVIPGSRSSLPDDLFSSSNTRSIEIIKRNLLKWKDCATTAVVKCLYNSCAILQIHCSSVFSLKLRNSETSFPASHFCARR